MDRVASELEMPIIDLGEQAISAYDYEHRNRRDDFEQLMELVLTFDQIVFASPVYWYSVAPPMKTFLDRISDFLDLPDLIEKGRRLRDKRGFVLCTSIYDEVPAPFISAFEQTFEYLGMEFGGYVHANCKEGYATASYEQDVRAFVRRLKSGA